MSEKFEKEVISMLTEQGKEIKEIKKTLDEHSQILQEHSKILQEHSKKFEEQDEINKRFNQAIINIEYAVTTKIPALFDAFSANLEKHQQYDRRINNLETTVEDHSNRISVLEIITSKK